MKNLFLSIVFITSLVLTSAAQDTNNSYGLSFGFGNGTILRQQLTGGPSIDLNTGLSAGFQYTHRLNTKLHLLTGVTLFNSSVTVTPEFHPDIDTTPRDYDVRVIYIPVVLKMDFGKHFFLNTGFLADIDVTKDSYITSQSGMGATVGAGAEFIITNSFSIQFNPYINFHGLLLTQSDDYPERVLESAVKINFVVNK